MTEHHFWDASSLGGSEFYNLHLRAFPSGLQLLLNGMSANYTKLERIRVDKIASNLAIYSHSMGTKPIARLMRASWRHGFQGDQDCPRCSVTRTRFALSDIYSLRAGSKWWLARKWPLTCGDAARMLAPDYRHPCIPAKWRKFTPREYEKE